VRIEFFTAVNPTPMLTIRRQVTKTKEILAQLLLAPNYELKII